MKKKFTILAAAIMLCAFLFQPLAMRGQTRTEIEATWTASEQGYANAADVTDITIDENISGTFAKASGSNAPKYYTSGEAVRMYNGNTLTITPSSDSEITEIEFTLSQSGGFTISTGEYSVEGLTGTWTGSSTEAIVFTNGSSQNRIQVIKVTYTTAGAPTPTHTLTFSATPEEGGTVTVGTNTTGSIDLAEGAERTITAEANSGYAFSNWTVVTGEGSSVTEATNASTTFIMGTEDATLTANFTAVATYTVTYKANGPEADDVVETYNEGENVTVAANTFNYAQHAFTKWNTLEGGTGTDYMPGDVIENIDADIELYAQWEESNETVDVLNWEATGSPTNYTDWTYTGPSGAEYAGQSSGTYQSIQLRSTNNNSGIVTTIPAGLVTKVAVTWNSNTANGRTLNVYGKNTAYEAATDLYNTDNAGDLLGTIVCGTSTELTIGNEYQYIGMRSASGALYLEEIQITWTNGSGVTPPSIAANNVEIAYDATEGAIEYTINNGVDGGVLSATTEAEWLTIGTVGETVPFTCTVNDNGQRAATVTLTYTYNTDQIATKNVTVTQDGNPNGPGSQNNPYTVAQARAAIDAGAGTQGVYATGIVSAIPTAYNSSYSNITFNMVDEEGDEEFLQAYRCIGDEAANVAIGDVVVVYGNLTKYGSTYEFGQGCQLVSLTHPAVTTPTITVTPATVNVDAELHAEQLPITYENIVVENYESFGVQFYDAEGEETEMPTTWLFVGVTEDLQNPGNYQVTCAIMANEGEARSAYLKVYAYDEESNVVYSNLVTITQAAYVVDYATLPFEFDGGRADFENTNGLTQEGLGTDYNSSPKLKFDGTGDWVILKFNEAPGTLTFDIKGNGFSGGTFTVQTSEDGMTYTDLQAYTELGNTQSESFANLGENVRYIKWIYTEKVSGNVALGNINLYQYGVGPVLPASITVAPATVNVNSDEHDGTLALTYENLTISAMTDFDIQYYDATGEEASAPDWIEVLVAEQDPTIGEGYVVSYYMMENTGEARSAYFKVHAQAGEETVYSNLVTINQEAYVAPPTSGEWVITSLSDLTENDVFVIVGVYDVDESSFAMPNNSTGAPSAVEVTMVGNTLSGDIDDNLKWNLSIGEDGYTFYPDGETETWLYCTNTNNGVRVGTNENNVFSMTSEGYLFNNATGRYVGIYNYQDWRCYTSINNNIKEQTFAFYKRVDESEIETYTLEIEGFGDTTNMGGYYLIASPVSMIRPTSDNGFLTEVGQYDLYYFDQAQQGYEWRNYKTKHFNIASGKGYLYASQESTTLTFTGVPYNGDGVFALSRTDDSNFAGWNLIGNPFSETAYVNRDEFYVMNPETGAEIIPASANGIDAMQGIFVIAEQNGETIQFSTTPVQYKSSVVMNVTQNRGNVIDRAIVRFGEGRQLPKFQLNPNNTKLYIPQNGSDYAVVRSTAEGEMPVNFKANRNGSYTLTVNTENIEMDYLHLIDNMTGADVDLLATPSYSFEARTTDYASRFRLVFSANNLNESEDGDSFGFVNGNGNLSIFGIEGEATVQVIDVQGHILSSETFSGSYEKQLNAAPGVYMIRLINGNDVKVQKIVIK